METANSSSYRATDTADRRCGVVASRRQATVFRGGRISMKSSDATAQAIEQLYCLYDQPVLHYLDRAWFSGTRERRGSLPGNLSGWGWSCPSYFACPRARSTHVRSVPVRGNRASISGHRPLQPDSCRRVSHAPHPKPPFVERDEDGVNFERVVFFSDAVVAIVHYPAGLRDPAARGRAGRVTTSSSRARARNRSLYALSFVIVGLYWVGHRRMFISILRATTIR